MYRIVRELSREANQPMPQLFVSPTAAPNAFASGRNPRNAVVCCTEGILQILDERELRGVLGPRVDARLQPGHPCRLGGGGIRRNDHDGRADALLLRGRATANSNPLVLIAMLILAPIAATFIRLAISRTREYDADQDGSALTGDPLALASRAPEDRGGGRRAARSPSTASWRTSRTS